MCFHFCVLPCFPWLLPVLTIGARAKRSNVSRTEITERIPGKSVRGNPFRSKST